MDINHMVHASPRVLPISDSSKVQTGVQPDMTNQKQPLHNRIQHLKDSNGDFFDAGTLSGYSKEQIDKAIEDANRLLVGKNTKFSYKIHEDTQRIIIELKDIQTDEVVKEIPPQKMLDIIADIWKQTGIIVDKKG